MVRRIATEIAEYVIELGSTADCCRSSWTS